MRCPTLAESISATLGLLPRGRAWQTHESGPQRPAEAAFQFGAYHPDAFSVHNAPGSILYRFWWAIGTVRNFLESRLCALRDEFWCASAVETRDQWMAEYGLPDPCDPFPDLCAKVSAIGGANCDYFSSIAARAGWEIACRDLSTTCGSRAGCSVAGRARAGGRRAVTLRLTVFVRESPSFTGRAQTPPVAGKMRAGRPIACPPNIDALRCLMDRIVPAHVTLQYVTAI